MNPFSVIWKIINGGTTVFYPSTEIKRNNVRDKSYKSTQIFSLIPLYPICVVIKICHLVQVCPFEKHNKALVKITAEDRNTIVDGKSGYQKKLFLKRKEVSLYFLNYSLEHRVLEYENKFFLLRENIVITKMEKDSCEYLKEFISIN